jgi:Uma2 family endonuclease
MVAIEAVGLSGDELMRRWAQVLADEALVHLPYKIELDQWGEIRMTPTASPRHMRIAFTLAYAFQSDLRGVAFQEGAVVTRLGVLTADVVWCSPAFVASHAEVFAGEQSAMPTAPEICVEVVSPTNVIAKLEQKIQAYLAAGAVEGWIVFDDLTVRSFDRTGERMQSQFAVDLGTWRRELGPKGN